ncbi:Heteropolysaccharide repeat unit export protein [Methanosarcina siciliae C2J]|uniref:Heteropolysaccharide repeat unit export protein n=1 Tax=Methanosarcina siciliae C2J TaxID=1434118 RepID=A0A0E3PRX8_9EURY|nr:Heteropolysaccharide repeat unit export protein [Methanosarcina siciliae C2J]
MGLIAGVLAMLISPALFEHLTGKGFDAQGKILSVVRIMIFAIPFTIVLNLAVAIYRGFDRTNVNTYFYSIIRSVSLLGFASAAVFLGVSLRGIVLADLLSMIFTFGIMSVYFIKRPPFKPEWKLKFGEPTRQLIRYSLPLLISATLLNIMTWTDTIMHGYFKSTEVVGVYNAVYPLVGFLSMVISSMGFVYIPVTSKLWGENKPESLGPIYQIMTKWCFMLTFPVFALMFVYPELLLTKIYGAEYASGALVLRILALGFVTNSYFGFNYHTIMASGDSDFLMKCSATSAGMNSLLNFILIPQYGMVGAAVASFVSIEILITLRTWRKQHLHPFTSMYRRMNLVGIFIIVFMLAARKALLLSGAGWEYAVFVIVYFGTIKAANVLDSTELNMIGEIRKAIRYNIRILIPQALKSLAS